MWGWNETPLFPCGWEIGKEHVQGEGKLPKTLCISSMIDTLVCIVLKINKQGIPKQYEDMTPLQVPRRRRTLHSRRRAASDRQDCWWLWLCRYDGDVLLKSCWSPSLEGERGVSSWGLARGVSWRKDFERETFRRKRTVAMVGGA